VLLADLVYVLVLAALVLLADRHDDRRAPRAIGRDRGCTCA
jgi:hypothetical protein